jgi:hypothetical protein
MDEKDVLGGELTMTKFRKNQKTDTGAEFLALFSLLAMTTILVVLFVLTF